MIATGQRVTLRRVHGMPRVTGTLSLSNGRWYLATENVAGRPVLELVGEGYESVIEAAIVANATEAA
jgi:hypothetical protein